MPCPEARPGPSGHPHDPPTGRVERELAQAHRSTRHVAGAPIEAPYAKLFGALPCAGGAFWGGP
eukprot:12957773-Alexandrium_andersonii.AAC.1